jgi:hypothetical protein
MWMDAEASNKFLEDLLHEYAVKLDAKEQHIQKLKADIRSLTQELQYYRSHQFIGSIYDEPTTIDVPNNCNKAHFNLNVPNVEVSLTDSTRENAYHIVAKITDQNKVSYSYYITKEALLSAKDKVGMLTYLHKKVLEEMERQLKNSS